MRLILVVLQTIIISKNIFNIIDINNKIIYLGNDINIVNDYINDININLVI